MFRQVVNFKKLNPDIGAASDFGANGTATQGVEYRVLTVFSPVVCTLCRGVVIASLCCHGWFAGGRCCLLFYNRRH